MRSLRLVALAATLALPNLELVAQNDQRAPSPDAKGKVFDAASSDGLAYQYFVPKHYDHTIGANLTFVLHGSNLDRRWGFLNHTPGEFRADDIVVCPDGTTSNGGSGFNFLQGKKDLERLHGLHEELKRVFHVRATLLYGHSQGSFFSFLYAGQYPDDVQGVVGQASGVWIGTAMTKKHHHQAIVLMHGTADPVVPYGQSVGGFDAYLAADYPLVRLRSLDGWNHWPTQHHTEQQLAWCEGMTTSDPARLSAAFTTLERVKEALDPAALWQVAKRACDTDGVPPDLAKKAAAAANEVEQVAAQHAEAIEKSLGKAGKGKRELDDKPWVGHLPLFVRHFRGVPACDELVRVWQKTFDAHEEAAKKHGRSFWRDREKKPKEAFAAGLALVREAFLTSAAENEEVLGALEGWAKDAKKAGLGKNDLKEFAATVPVFRDAREAGRKAFDKIDRRLR